MLDPPPSSTTKKITEVLKCMLQVGWQPMWCDNTISSCIPLFIKTQTNNINLTYPCIAHLCHKDPLSWSIDQIHQYLYRRLTYCSRFLEVQCLYVIPLLLLILNSKLIIEHNVTSLFQYLKLCFWLTAWVVKWENITVLLYICES